EQASGIGGQFRGGWRGVRGLSRVGVGVEGFSNSNNGVFGTSNNSVGILGTSTNEQGVRGESLGVGKAGVYGISVSGVGVGVRGESTLLSGVIGSSEDGPGVTGTSTKHHGIIGSSDASQTSGKFDFYATGTAMDYGASSSRRWKTDITPIADALELVSQMRGVRYTWDEEHGAGRRDIGFIAEEVGEVFPEIVAYDPNGIDADALDYTKIPAVLVRAINELHAKHQQEISELRSEIQLLKELVQSSNAAADSASLRPTMQPNKSK
ncbi:MAG: tail fiber domain-containing protein, partial [Bacteroidota bacterium]